MWSKALLFFLKNQGMGTHASSSLFIYAFDVPGASETCLTGDEVIRPVSR